MAEAAPGAEREIERPETAWPVSDISGVPREHAAYEATLAEEAQAGNYVDRGAWFWSQFENATPLRIAFRGNVDPSRDYAPCHHYRGYGYEPGQSIAFALVQGWAIAYENVCGEHLPADAPVYESVQVIRVRKA